MRPTSHDGDVTGFLAAVQFLTRVPIRLRAAPEVSRAAPWFPVVGLLIGAVVGGIAAGMLELVPAAVAATVAVLAGTALTGAFHEDGLADTMDAMGGWTPERRREILRDSRHGSYGVAAMCGTIVLRIVCIASLSPAVAFAGCVSAHGLGRAGAVGVMATAPPMSAEGLGADYARAIRRPAAALGIAAAVIASIGVVGWWAAPLVVAVVVVALIMTTIARRAFGGINGDVLGAVEQLGECAVLVVISGLALRHPLWWS